MTVLVIAWRSGSLELGQSRRASFNTISKCCCCVWPCHSLSRSPAHIYHSAAALRLSGWACTCLTVNRCTVGLKCKNEPNLSPAIIIDLHQPDHVTAGRLLAPFFLLHSVFILFISLWKELFLGPDRIRTEVKLSSLAACDELFGFLYCWWQLEVNSL